MFRESSMKPHRISVLFALLSVLWLGAAPAWGVNKDMVQLQTQVQQLQEQMTAMQRSFDERMGVMKNLVEQDTDAVNKVAERPERAADNAAEAAGRCGRRRSTNFRARSRRSTTPWTN